MSTKLKRALKTTPAFALTALALAAGSASAQSTGSGETQATETIIVTARRVDERIIDVPLTIRALTGKDLSDRGITSLTDLATFTPGLSYSPDLGRVSERPVIRGISALRPEAPQPVSVFVDGLYLRSGALSLPLDDALRVEVIKGPQSALYGRSTYAGAINYITVKPGSELKGTATVTAGQAREFSAFGAVSVPLIKDVLAMRVKARTHQFGGQYFNTQTGNAVGSESTDSIGALFAFTPGPAFDATLSLDHSDVRDGLFNAVARTVPTQAGGVLISQNGSSNVPNGAVCNGRTVNIVGNNAAGLPDANVPASATNRLNGWPCGSATHATGTLVRRNQLEFANYTDPTTGISYGNVAGLDRTIDRTGLTMNYEFAGGYTLTSQTGFTRDRAHIGSDESYNGTQFAITGASWLSYNRDLTRYWSQELRLASPDKSALTWLVGAFIYDEDTSGVSSGVIQRVSGVVSAAPLRPKSGSATVNAAPFARVQYAFTPALRVSAEGRYNRETVEVIGTNLGTATVSAGTCVAGQPCSVTGKRTFTDFSPRITLDWKPGADSLIYVQGARGSKGGGFNTAAGITADRFTFEGETITAAEIGFKTVLASGKLGFNAALFRNDIEGLQLSNIITITNPFSANPQAPTSTTVTVVNNVGKARTQGVEFDLSWRAADWLTLIANYAFTDAKVLEGTEVTNGTVFGGNQSVAGFTLPRTPKHAAAFSAAIDTPLVGTTRWTARADVTYQSRRYAEIQNMIWAEPYTRVNLATGVRGKDWRVSLWVKNATDDDTSLNGFRYLDPVTFRRSAVDFLPRLRQVGLTGSIDF